MPDRRSMHRLEAQRHGGNRAATLLRICLLLGPLILGMLLLMLPVWVPHGQAEGLPSCGQSRTVAGLGAGGCGAGTTPAFGSR